MPALPVQNTTADQILTGMREEISLDSIRRSMKATSRGKERKSLQGEHLSTELEVYLNQTMFDLSLRLDTIDRYLRDESRAERVPPEILDQVTEMLKELRLSSDIGNFAIGKLTPRS